MRSLFSLAENIEVQRMLDHGLGRVKSSFRM